MRPINNFALHAIAAAALAALAATSAAAQSNYFIKLDGMDPGGRVADNHKEQIEILSFEWGATRAKGNVEYTWKVEEGESAPPPPGGAAKFGAVSGMHRDADMTLKGSKIGQNARKSGEKGGTEDINIGVGELQEAPARGGVRVASGDVDGDGRAAKKPKTTTKMLAPGATRPTTGAAVGGAVGSYANDGDEAASGPPTGKRQHKPVTFSKPLDKGSVWVRVATPWNACRIGAHYPSIELGSGTERHLLQDVTVASCGGTAAGDDRPTEEVAFYYNRIAFNYGSVK